MIWMSLLKMHNPILFLILNIVSLGIISKKYVVLPDNYGK